ncbi:MAG: hypothetical protein NVSMB47_13950 [Polyangiales bacterium]
MSEPVSPGAVAVVESGPLVERLERALDAVGGPAHAALATDGDGTLWTSDVGEALFAAILATDATEHWLRDDARAPLHAELVGHVPDVAPPETSSALARTLWDLYVAGRFPEDRMCAAMTWCMAGSSLTALGAFAGRLLEHEFGLKNRLIPESGHVLQWAARRGVPTFLVSASPRVVVERAARTVAEAYAIPAPTVLAMTPALDGDVIRPALVGVWTYGEGKTEALAAALAVERRSLVAAMGDNVFDAAMLRAAPVPIAIRPKPALTAIAASIPGLVRAAIVGA